MHKKLISILLALIIAISLLPMSAMALTQKEETQIKAQTTGLIKDYAASIYKENADDASFSDYFNHGFYGNGKAMKLTENSAMISALFNSRLLQEALINAISQGIITMQTNQIGEMYQNGTVAWHEYYYDYGFVGYQSIRIIE